MDFFIIRLKHWMQGRDFNMRFDVKCPHSNLTGFCKVNKSNYPLFPVLSGKRCGCKCVHYTCVSICQMFELVDVLFNHHHLLMGLVVRKPVFRVSDKAQELEVLFLNHPYSLIIKSSQCHYVVMTRSETKFQAPLNRRYQDVFGEK